MKSSLQEIVEMKVIQKVEKHSDCVSKILSVKIVLDSSPLDKALKSQNYQVPTVEEIFTELAQSNVFSTLNAKHSFWQLLPFEHRSVVTNTYNYIGIEPAVEIFQNR